MAVPWCAPTVSGQGGAFGSLAAAALRAGASAASGISPGTKKFFCKSVFHTKATPFMRAEPFLGKFLGEGPRLKSQNGKSPRPGGERATSSRYDGIVPARTPH